VTTSPVRPAPPSTPPAGAGWAAVCHLDDLLPERGAAALLGDRQVALFRLHDDRVAAIDNRDPVCGAYVLSRGLVGCRDGRSVVLSPMHKQAYDLATGVCLDLAGTAVRVHPTRVRGGVVEVALG
jgi:NAD(P)H-dependent nitrite reductase small subunit